MLDLTPLARQVASMAVALTAVVLTACGSPGAPIARTSAASVSGPAPCRTAALTVTVDTGQGGGAAGSSYLPIDFTSTSGAACTLYGYPGVSFVSGHPGNQVGAAARRAQGFASMRVTLGPGRVAHAWLQVAAARNYPAHACGPVTAHWLRVFPPGETSAAYLSRTFTACRSAKVPVLGIMPVRAGRGVRGSIP